MVYGPRRRRPGATVVESAFALPVTLFLIFGVIIGGMGIFRYQEMAHLAREAARYAGVHGGQYAQENAQAIQQGTLPDVTEDYLITQVVKARAVNLNPSNLQVTVSVNTPNGTYDWDNTGSTNNRWPTTTVTQGGSTVEVTNTVQVTVTYQWYPELFLAGPLTLTSTSVVPMSY